MPPLTLSPVRLTAELGEIVSPGALLTALILSPDGAVALDPAALHGRSEIEQSLQVAPAFDRIQNAQTYWMIWVAAELDDAGILVRYAGLTASELWVDPVEKIGYKLLADHVNRMADAVRGDCNLRMLSARERALIAAQLASLGPGAWARTSNALKEALA